MKKIILLSVMLIATLGASAQYEGIVKGTWLADVWNNDDKVVAALDLSEILPLSYAENAGNFDLTVTYKSGTTITFQNMKRVFIRKATDPLSAPRMVTEWDWDMMKHCGANYDTKGNVHFSAATKGGFVLCNFGTDTVKISKSSLQEGIFDNPDKILSPYYVTDPIGHVGYLDPDANADIRYGVIYPVKNSYIPSAGPRILVLDFGTRASTDVPVSWYAFNNGEFRIKTLIKQNADGSITVQCVGLDKSCTFR